MNERLSLSELQLIIRDSLYMALPDFYWVIAEISEIKANYAGHCYLELIEKLPDDTNAKARVRAIIWNKRYRFLKSWFENSTGEELREGMKILVKTKIEYHELYGLSLVITDIDPSFTIGEMAMKKQMVIRRLEEEGVFSMNKELEFPFLPQRIAVISSKSAAGYIDFVKHLRNNSYGYIFYTALFESVMQGAETEKSVMNALDRIADKTGLFDVVVIIRGGGSQSDLSWFDSYNIAYYVTQFPIPVITGIGHEKDLTVTDMVAYQSLKTPTAVADYLMEYVADAENKLNDLGRAIAENSRSAIEESRKRIESFRMKLIPLARLMLSDQKEQISNNIIELVNFGKDFIIRAGLQPANQKSRLISAAATFISARDLGVVKSGHDLKNNTLSRIDRMKVKIEGLQSSLGILDPVNVLRRGYTITTSGGRIMKSCRDTKTGDQISTRFSDGEIESKVLKIQDT